MGRRAEQQRVHALLGSAREGDGGALVFRGEAGVGKSVLLAYASEHARASGFGVLAAAGVELESELAFSALATLLEGAAGSVGQLPAAEAAVLRSALGLGAVVAADRFAVYRAVRDLLALLARQAPLLVVVDDVQWIDSASHEALAFAARRLASERVAMLFAVRSDDGAGPDWLGVAECEVRGLEPADAEQLVAVLAPASSENVRRVLGAGTGGNPLAIAELVRRLTPAQLAGRDPLQEPLPVAGRLEELFGARLRELPEKTRAALVVAAASESGAMDVVLAALDRLELERSALELGEEVGLLQIVRGELAWRHPLVRAASYHCAPAPARRAAHRALAEVAGESRLEEHRAWHLAAGAEAPDEGIAAALEGVAERARIRGALAAAMRALIAAADLSIDEESKARRLVSAAEAAVALGQADEALGLIARALALSERAELRAHAERVRARVEILRGVPVVAHELLVATAESIAEEHPELAVELFSEAIVANMADGNTAEYTATAAKAIETARRAGPGAEALPGLLLALGRLAEGGGDEAIALFDRHRHIAEQPGLWAAAPEIVGMAALGLVWIERFDEAARLLALVTAFARDSSALRTLAFPLAVEADMNLRRGRWPAALTGALEAVQLAEDIDEAAILASNLTHLARIEAPQGREDARAHARRALQITEACGLAAIEPYARHALGFIELSAGDAPRAIAHLEPIRTMYSGFSGEPGHALWDGDLAEAYIRAGNNPKAEDAVRRYATMVQRTGRRHGRAVLARLRGLQAPNSGFDDHFTQALRWHTAAAMPFERARTELYYGERLRRARRRTDAKRHLANAASTFAMLGANPWAERARLEQLAAGERLSATETSPSWSALTASETRVAQAILSGATYQETADGLYLSPRTVEFHLRQIYRKLGIRSRNDLAARLSPRE